jgi:Rrf2 family nitric oxide-sensitive transcriptional repressor
MRITQHTDYALRVLMYVGANPERLVTIAEIAERFAISRTHLMKVVNQLVREGFLHGQRGKGGGLRLAMKPEGIHVGDVIRHMEPDLNLVECFGEPDACLINRGCRLKRALVEALDAFLVVLDRYTLADLLGNPATVRLLSVIQIVPSGKFMSNEGVVPGDQSVAGDKARLSERIPALDRGMPVEPSEQDIAETAVAPR